MVASDIPAHRELIGTGSFLADPRSPGSLAKAVRATAGKSGVRDRQLQRLQAHRHADLETVDRRPGRSRTCGPPTVDIPAAAGVRWPAAPERRHRRALAAAAHGDRRLLRGHHHRAGPAVRRHRLHDVGRRRGRVGAGRCADRPRAGSTTSSPTATRTTCSSPSSGNSHFHLPFIEVVEHGRLRGPRPRHPAGRAVPGAARPRWRRAGHAARQGQAVAHAAAGRADRRHAPAGVHRVLGGRPPRAHARRPHAHRRATSSSRTRASRCTCCPSRTTAARARTSSRPACAPTPAHGSGFDDGLVHLGLLRVHRHPHQAVRRRRRVGRLAQPVGSPREPPPGGVGARAGRGGAARPGRARRASSRSRSPATSATRPSATTSSASTSACSCA